MKNSDILIYAVVLWALIESRYARRLERSLDVEGRGSNLTQKQQQETIHADVLQHFTSTPPSAPESLTDDSRSSFIKDVGLIPEDINIQSLKNEDHLHVVYDRKLSISNENYKSDSTLEQNKTLNSNLNDVIAFNINRSDDASSTISGALISHSSYEHSSTSVVYDENYDDDGEEKQIQTQGHQPVQSSSTEKTKLNLERKNVDVKKKDKGKKDISDPASIPPEFNGAGKVEKHFKDNVNIKLKDKNKESISEALDDIRSTTRISSSVSVSDQDNNRLSSLESPKINSSGTSNKEVVNQSVNSVINVNGVNNDVPKKTVVKNLLNIVEDDSEPDKTAVSNVHLVEDTAKNTVPVVSSDLQTTPSSLFIGLESSEKDIPKQFPPLKRSQLTEPFPTKGDVLAKVTIPSSSSTTIVKPSIAFKQQLANKLKGYDPSPTAPIISNDDETDEGQGKSSGKSPTKFTLRKKSKLEQAPLPEMNIPPTATAWSLASLKSSTEGMKTTQKLKSLGETASNSPQMDTTTPRLTTLVPVSRVKSFVPWSTRLLKNTSLKPPTTSSIDVVASPENTSDVAHIDILHPTSTSEQPEKFDPTKAEPSSTSVIRTTMELDRNLSETPINTVQSMPNDVMIKDQSSTTSHGSVQLFGSSTTEILETSNSSGLDQQSTIQTPKTDEESAFVENVVESKRENNTIKKNESEDKGKTETPFPLRNTDISKNKLAPPQENLNENVNEIKFSNDNQSSNNVLTTSKTSPEPESYDKLKVKNVNDIGQLDSGNSDVGIDGTGEDGKSGEESEEEERQNQTTTLPPIFEPFETTVLPDSDEDEGESDRGEDDLSLPINKPNLTSTEIPDKHKETNLLKSSVSSSVSLSDVNNTGSFVTSFDIITKENTTQVVTSTPLEGNINWYSVDTKGANESVEETSQKPLPTDTTTTETLETTIETETTTEAMKEESTILPEITDTVTTMSPTTTYSPVAQSTTTESIENADLDGIEDASSCIRIVVHISPLRLCDEQEQLRKSIAAQLVTREISWEQIVIVSGNLQECEIKNLSTKEQDLDINVCFFDENLEPSPSIRNEFFSLYAKRESNGSFPILRVQMIMDPSQPEGFDNVLAAIILSVIAAICLVLLGILLVIVRKRQGRFNYGQRCTPVSLDDYSLDNISVYNSVRRKGALRASKRSYGNPGFDDPGGPSHPINFAGLANFSSDREALDEEFNQIPMITVKPDELPPGAESKNRYANVIPLPETRVILQTKESADPLDEYINANYIKGPKGQERMYIACQAPLQSTIEDFWKMVWQQQTKVILMLTALNENGVEKCADYLPQLEITDCHRLFGDFQVTLKKHEVREKYIISSLQLKNLETNSWREVTHLWYVSWPAQGVPEDGSSMIAFLIEARSYMRGAQGPTVVHCSPGTGRTGTVIAIDLCIRDFETLRSVDIPKTVYALRRDRAGAVQTKDQYAFIYQVLNLYATKLTGGALDSI